MLPGGDDAMYRAALTTAHTAYVNVQVLDGAGALLYDDLPIVGGSVSAALVNGVSRTLDLALDETWYPWEPDDLLNPYGNRIRAWRGIEFADGRVAKWVVFTGRIQRAGMVDNGQVKIDAADRASEVAEFKFVKPENAQAGNDIDNEAKRVIGDAVPDAVFGTFDTFTPPVAPMTWQQDRVQALSELSTSVGALWYPQAPGEFRLRRYPWTQPGSPVVFYRDGEGGSVSKSFPARDRGNVFNSATVTGERLNGSAPKYATAQDDNPASPTWIGGNFGRRHKLIRLQTPATQDAADDAARENLRRLTALQESWNWEMVPDAALELGDVAGLSVRGRTGIVQVVTAFRIPLDLASAMTVQGRSQALAALEGA